MIPLHLQPESHVPLYIQLRDQIRALVHGGDLRPGERIPASRELATQLGVHRTTVANAYAELESEGLISGHVGRGTFIRGESVRQKNFRGSAPDFRRRRPAVGIAVCRRARRRNPEPPDAGGPARLDLFRHGQARR